MSAPLQIARGDFNAQHELLFHSTTHPNFGCCCPSHPSSQLQTWYTSSLDARLWIPFGVSLSLDFVFVGPSHKTRPLYSSWRAFFSHRPLDDDHYYCGVTAVKTSSSRVPLYATKPPLMGPISTFLQVCQQPEKKLFGAG